MPRRRAAKRRVDTTAIPVTDQDLMGLWADPSAGTSHDMLQMLQRARDRQRRQPFGPPSRPLPTGFTLSDEELLGD
jgi:hypothetical protein